MRKKKANSRLSTRQLKIWHEDYLVYHYLWPNLDHTIQKALKEIGKDLPIVLDVGCGNKPYQDWFGDSMYVGLNYSIANAEPDVVGDAMQLPFANESFDLVFATQVLEHLSEPSMFLEESFRVLRPGGIIRLHGDGARHRTADAAGQRRTARNECIEARLRLRQHLFIAKARQRFDERIPEDRDVGRFRRHFVPAAPPIGRPPAVHVLRRERGGLVRGNFRIGRGAAGDDEGTGRQVSQRSGGRRRRAGEALAEGASGRWGCHRVPSRREEMTD